MTEGLHPYELEIDFPSNRSRNFKGFVTWNKDQKTLTRIYRSTNQEVGSSDYSLCEAFEKYKGKNLRVKLNGKQVTLSVRGDVPTYNAEGYFQIAYSEGKEGWLTKEVFFEVQNLTEWVYSEMWEEYWENVSKDFGNRSEGLSEWLTDNKKSWFASLGAGLFCVKLRNVSPKEFHFEYLNEKFTLTLYDEHAESRCSPFHFSYDRECYFGIISSREHDKEFFETLIRKITYFLSLLFGKRAVANRIFESEEQQWRWDYNPSEKENPSDFCYVNIPYSAISGEFGNKLTQWLLKYERYGTIIDSFFHDENKRFSKRDGWGAITREEKEIMKETFLKRLNRLETYGNILTEDDDTYKDIKEAVSAVDNEVVSGIICEIPSRYARWISDKEVRCYFYDFGKTPEDKKEDFAKIVTAFRNYFVHPFRGGKKKTPSGEGIEKFFTTAGLGSLGNFEEAMNRLSQCLSVILHCVLLQSKSVRENKGVIKSSQNLFPETNHTREDYGKIILKYLHQCLDDKGTSETLKECTARVKNILLFSREEATPKKDVKEAFEKNEKAFGKDKQQQNIWALRPICECITHDFRENRLHKEQKNLGELIINLKNSFDPNVNSLFCEQFTDYKNSDVDFKAFSRLTDILSDILHQLLLQEAGLTEFLKKKRMHRVPCRINV